MKRRIGALGVASTAAGLALWISGSNAQAQGWAIDRYEPNPAGDVFFVSDFPWYNRTRLFALGIIGDYARNPLVVYQDGQVARHVISDMAVLHLQASVALFDRVGIHVSVPISMWQDGDAATPSTFPGLTAYNSAVTGDINVGLRVRLVGDADRDPISLHIGGHAYLGFIPYNGRVNNVADESFRWRAYATLAGHPRFIRYSLSLGFYDRDQLGGDATGLVGPEVYLNAALGVASRDGRVTVGPEFTGSYAYTLSGSLPVSQRVSGEVLFGLHYLIADTFLFGAGAGPGITQATGTPEVRGLVRLAYAPESHPAPPPVVLDSDFDGIPDSLDACPYEPQGAHPDPQHPGCPLHDADGDGVEDGEDQCPHLAAGDHPDPTRRGCPEADSDGDGVYDHEDQCPTTPAGAHPDPTRPGCPDGDRDGDGVLDHQDQCPDVPAGPHPDPARPGCPLADRDQDTVPDATDHCPDQPGAPNVDPMRNGCPSLVRVEASQIRILQQVLFATNRATILPRSFPLLQAVADVFQAVPQIRRVSIEGHTDNRGPAARNQRLSQQRAEAVMAWLVAHQVEASRLEAHGFGDTRPLAPNTAEVGRAQNRRVEFRIVDQGGVAASPAPLTPASTPPAMPRVD